MVTSALYPFRESFYQRMGYVNFARPHVAKFTPAELAPLLKQELSGHVEWLSTADGYDAYRDYVIRLHKRTHGMAVFDQPEKEATGPAQRELGGAGEGWRRPSARCCTTCAMRGATA